MAGVDLLFGLPFDGDLPADLIFGDDGSAPIASIPLAVRGRLPGLRGPVRLSAAKQVQIKGRIPGLRGSAAMRYSINVQRPIVNATTGRFQQAARIDTGLRARFQAADTVFSAWLQRFQEAAAIDVAVTVAFQEAERLRVAAEIRFQEAARLATAATLARFQEGSKTRAGASVRFQEAERLPTTPLSVRYQETYRDRRNYTAVRFQEALPYSVSWTEHEGAGVPLNVLWTQRYQEAMKPPIGIRVPPEPPKPEPCYRPVLPTDLLFIERWDGSANLLFSCNKQEPPDPEPGDTIVVPVKEVYLTINSAILIRLDNGYIIPTNAMSMALDVDSWTWSFSASVPGSALQYVMPNSNGDPVVVQASINGTPFRFTLEQIRRDRTFGRSALNVSGRGLAAELDAPYAPVQNFGNSQARTARQLLDDILAVNGVGIGWDVLQFQPTDWLLPAGVFSHTGTYISAINAVAGAVGAYVQPHNTAKSLNVLLRYPTPSWEWAGMAPDYELPAAVTTQEGFEWVDKPRYNRVFVSGQEQGVTGQYTRRGTAGDVMAPAVIDPLITHADAARQRGRTIISDTGRVATVTLKLPVLAETGVIKPGKSVRYVEGGVHHLGITRSVSVDVAMPTIYQTLTVETHVEPV